MYYLEGKNFLRIPEIACSNSQEKIDVSIIIIVNNQNIFNDALSYIEEQEFEGTIELVVINNIFGAFKSAASALNYAVNNSHGQYLIFMHQDVFLTDKLSIKKYVNFLKKNENSIIGAAGVMVNCPGGLTDVYVGVEKPVRKGHRCFGNTIQAETLDECYFAMTRQLSINIRFDETCCYDWHLYTPDICYSNILRGGTNYIVPLDIWHKSDAGSMSKHFYKTLLKMRKKYRKTSLNYINTTCAFVRLKSPLSAIKIKCMMWGLR